MTAVRLIVHRFFALIQFLLTQLMVDVAEFAQRVSNQYITRKIRQVHVQIYYKAIFA